MRVSAKVSVKSSSKPTPSRSLRSSASISSRTASKPRLTLSSKRSFASQTKRDPRTTPVIVAAGRTPVGSFQGALSSFTSPQLGAFAIKGALKNANIKVEDIPEAYLGNVISSGSGQAPARQAVLGAGLLQTTITTTVNKVCSSGMKTVMLASNAIRLGDQSVILAGGFESMSNIPYYMPKARSGYRYGNGSIEDGIVKDGLSDAFNNQLMGWCAEECVKKYNISREDQDAYAIGSYEKAQAATKEGKLKGEIIPVTVAGKKGDSVIVSEDEEIKNIKLDKIKTLKGVFLKENGTITAANASKLSDGGAAIVVTSEQTALDKGWKVLARVLGYADAEQDPVWFTTAPSVAIPKALKIAGVDAKSVDYYEINEAFSAVAIANQKLLNLDPTRLNIWGGAVAIGHPLGMSGARIIISLINILKDKNASIGVAGICNGGGGASSIVLERV